MQRHYLSGPKCLSSGVRVIQYCISRVTLGQSNTVEHSDWVCFDRVESKCGFFLSFFFFFLIFPLFLERGRKGEREGEKHQCVVVSWAPPLGTWPATQACALTRNRTTNPLVHSPVLKPLSHTNQGQNVVSDHQIVSGELSLTWTLSCPPFQTLGGPTPKSTPSLHCWWPPPHPCVLQKGKIRDGVSMAVSQVDGASMWFFKSTIFYF